HIDGSKHQWFGDQRWHDLIVILDDGTSEIYYAQLVEEESTRTVMAGLREVIETQGLFCSLYSDRGHPLFLYTQGRRESRQTASDTSGPGAQGVGGADDSGLFPASARAQRAQLRDLAREVAARAAAGRDSDGRRGQSISTG